MVDSLAMPAPPTRLRPGRHGLDPAYVASHQRARIIAAFVHAVAERGYPNVTLSEVAAAALVSKKTIHSLFGDKTGCFLAAYDEATERFFGAVSGVFDAMPSPGPARTRSVLDAVLATIAAEPDFGRLCLVEVSYAGPAAMARYQQAIERIVDVFAGAARYDEARSADVPVSPDGTLLRALVGGVISVIQAYLLAGEAAKLPTLLPTLTYFLLGPLVGARQAAETAYAPVSGGGASRS